jgi:hypothetical protein
MDTATTGYTLVKASTPLINGSALLNIIIVSVAAGCGLAIAFGLILLGTEWGQEARSSSGKLGGWVLGLLAAAFCVFAIVLGIHIMVNPKGSSPSKVVPSSSSTSLVVTHHRSVA